MALFLHALDLVLMGCAGGVVAGFVIWVVIALIAFVEWVHDRLRRHSRLEYERYCAEQDIRSIRRQAVRDMLEAESEPRLAYHQPDVIEGSAVEVRRS
jgi:hypothetical protein